MLQQSASNLVRGEEIPEKSRAQSASFADGLQEP
jgi:hypothetical protein